MNLASTWPLLGAQPLATAGAQPLAIAGGAAPCNSQHAQQAQQEQQEQQEQRKQQEQAQARFRLHVALLAEF